MESNMNYEMLVDCQKDGKTIQRPVDHYERDPETRRLRAVPRLHKSEDVLWNIAGKPIIVEYGISAWESETIGGRSGITEEDD